MSGVGVTFFPSQKAFSPLDIAGCVLWYDAADAASVTPGTSSSATSQWNDKSGGGFHVTQANVPNRPTYVFSVLNGKNILRFNGSNSTVLSLLGQVANFLNGVAGWTVFTVTKTTTFANEQSVICGTFGSNSNRFFYSGTALITSGFSQTGGRQQTSDASKIVATDSTARSTSAFQITTGTATIGGSVTQYVNNVQTAQTTPYFTSGVIDATGKNLYIGVDVTSDFFTGDMAELLVYNTELSSGNQTIVYNYLKAKWGL